MAPFFAATDILAGICQKTRSMIGMQGTQTHQPAASRSAGRLPALSL
jgi:hypothetical protein